MFRCLYNTYITEKKKKDNIYRLKKALHEFKHTLRMLYKHKLIFPLCNMSLRVCLWLI